jgi:hypothetical protein
VVAFVVGIRSSFVAMETMRFVRLYTVAEGSMSMARLRKM